MYRLSGFLKKKFNMLDKLNLQNCVNSMEKCVQVTYTLYRFE